MGPILRQLRFQEVLANRLMWTFLLGTTGIEYTIVLSNGQESMATKLLYLMGAFGCILINNLRKRAEKPLKWHTHPHSHRQSKP